MRHTDAPMWWVDSRNLIHVYRNDQFAQTKIYARMDHAKWEYAIVEWRAGSAYLTGLYRNGESLPADYVLDAIRLDRWGEYEIRRRDQVSQKSPGASDKSGVLRDV